MNPKARWQLAAKQLVNKLRSPNASGKVVAYPVMRNFVRDVMREGRRKNIFHFGFEADLSAFMNQRSEASASAVSITAFLSHCFAATIDDDRSICAYRLGRRRLVVFDDVDLVVMVEREIDSAVQPVPLAVRSANRKGVADISRELRESRFAKVGEAGPLSALEWVFFQLPDFLRYSIWFVLRRNPYWFKETVGTAGVSSVGMYSSGLRVGIPITPMTLTLFIGSVQRRTEWIGDKPVERDFIHLGLAADHDIVDGGPLMRFMARLRQRISAGLPSDALVAG